jgi:hypothetical protein
MTATRFNDVCSINRVGASTRLSFSAHECAIVCKKQNDYNRVKALYSEFSSLLDDYQSFRQWHYSGRFAAEFHPDKTDQAKWLHSVIWDSSNTDAAYLWLSRNTVIIAAPSATLANLLTQYTPLSSWFYFRVNDCVVGKFTLSDDDATHLMLMNS